MLSIANQSALRVKPDPRGRLPLGKAIAAVNARLATTISSFDVTVADDGTITLRPTVEIPAQHVTLLGAREWETLMRMEAEPPSPPNEYLRRAALETRQDRIADA